MENDTDNLTRELLKRTFGNLGAVPGKNFGKTGITTEEFICQKKLTIKIENLVYENNIYSGQINLFEKYNVILANVNSLEIPEFIVVLQAGKNIFGLRLLWDGFDVGSFVIFHDTIWTELSLQYKLNLTSAIEAITQEGIIWQPDLVPDSNLFEHLATIVENFS